MSLEHCLHVAGRHRCGPCSSKQVDALISPSVDMLLQLKRYNLCTFAICTSSAPWLSHLAHPHLLLLRPTHPSQLNLVVLALLTQVQRSPAAAPAQASPDCHTW
jgi:hypothetical protein